MTELFNETFLVACVVAVVAHTIPLMLAAIGETVGQQSGMLGLGMEGLLAVGGYFGFVGVLTSGNFWVGALWGVLAGALLSCVVMVLCVWFGVNQIVVGIGVILAGTGISSMLYEANFSSSKPRLGAAPAWQIPLLSDIPVIGEGLFAQPGMCYFAVAAVPLTSIWMYRTAPGLRLRAAGRRPYTLDLAGGNVLRIRSFAVLFCGALSGFGGAYLALISAGTYTPGMTGGLGFLAIVVTMLARGTFTPLLLASLGYGIFVAAGTVLQLTSLSIPNDVIHMLPFIAVMTVLTVFARTSMLPPALTTPYLRGHTR